MTTLEGKLNELLDREAIRNLPQRYCDAIWRGDAEGVAALFTEDAVVSAEGSGALGREHLFPGRAAILDVYSHPERFGIPRPFCHQIIIDQIGPDHAKGRVYLELRLGGDNMDYWASNVCEDEYRKVNGEWKFSKRHSIMFEHRPAVRDKVQPG